jgi:hypothetical protein
MSDTPAPIVDLVKAPTQELYRPVMSIAAAIERREQIVQFVSGLMKEGVDYGTIPGTNKPTLLKPGAEKLCSFFGLEPQYAVTREEVDLTGSERSGGEPFYYIGYHCRLSRDGRTLGVGEGSCNSWESKYRWREGKRKCPDCGAETIFKSKDRDEWYCWAKRGGCGMVARFSATGGSKYEQIASQSVGRVPNPDVADHINTIQKMAQKRALIQATLLAISASEFFTQDLEDAEPQQNTPVEQAALAERRIKETRGEGPAQGAGDSPALSHVEPPAHPASKVPAPLRVLFDGLSKKGYLTQAYQLLKLRLTGLAPEDATMIYESIIDGHKARDTKDLAVHKAVLLEMWNTADKIAAETAKATDDDLPVEEDDDTFALGLGGPQGAKQ